jgi:hypothetical protein
MKKCTILLLAVALMFTVSTRAKVISERGVLPLNLDGFETGDYENFALVYIGQTQDWIHPRAQVTEEQPISGKYSLRWNADDKEQRWMFVSNAFYLRKPFTVSVKVRIDAKADKVNEAALLGAIESYNKQGQRRRAIVDALRLSGCDVYLDINADAANWANGADAKKGGVIKPNVTYTLSMAYGQDGTVLAKVVSDDNHQVIAKFSGKSKTNNNGVGLFVHPGSAKDGYIMYDDFKVKSAAYQMKANEWTRCPRFVILPRLPDVPQGQGNWVGAASAMYDEGIYKLWYRIRKAEVRGAGYGYATSKDGLCWQKYKDNPVMPFDEIFDRQKYSSCEKISVLKIDGQYKAWYTINAPKEWHIVYATSDDGIHWTQHGEVLKDGYYKDPDVVYVNGTYYMYVIHPTEQEMSVLTSKDGVNWTFRSPIPAPGHTHPAAYYVQNTGKFWLYEDIPGIKAAWSDDGIGFSDFQEALSVWPVGLDDNHIRHNGANYPTFFRDNFGHLKTDKDILMIYQARHSYLNNRPSWKFAEDGKLVLAGKFTGLHLNVPTEIASDGGITYSAFPIHCRRIDDLAVTTDGVLKVTVNSWTPSVEEVGSWVVKAKKTDVKYSVSNLVPAAGYELLINGQVKNKKTVDEKGTVEFEVEVTGQQACRLVKVQQEINQ